MPGFNPHPPLRASATRQLGSTVALTACTAAGFNPHPPLRASATPPSDRRPARVRLIQFQSSPAPEGECNPASALSYAPMLIRGGFNPHPPLRASATWQQRGWHSSHTCFNPHPPLRASATLEALAMRSWAKGFQSSPAPEGECNTITSRGMLLGPEEFQSSPAPEGECNRGPSTRASRTWAFQSSPAPEGECNNRKWSVTRASWSFNPHPPLRASATLMPAMPLVQDYLFQSSPAPEGECNAPIR